MTSIIPKNTPQIDEVRAAGYRLAYLATAEELREAAEQSGVVSIRFDVRHADDYVDNAIEGHTLFDASGEVDELDEMDDYLHMQRGDLADLLFSGLVEYPEGKFAGTRTVTIAQLPRITDLAAIMARSVIDNGVLGLAPPQR